MWLFVGFLSWTPSSLTSSIIRLSAGWPAAASISAAAGRHIKAQSSPHAFHCLFPVHSFVYISHHITHCKNGFIYIERYAVAFDCSLLLKSLCFLIEKKRREETLTCSLSLRLQIASSACIPGPCLTPVPTSGQARDACIVLFLFIWFSFFFAKMFILLFGYYYLFYKLIRYI